MNQKHILLYPRFLILLASFLPQNFSFLSTSLLPTSPHFLFTPLSKLGKAWSEKAKLGTKSESAELATKIKHLKWKGRSRNLKVSSLPFLRFFLVFLHVLSSSLCLKRRKWWCIIEALQIFWGTQMWVPNRKQRKSKESRHVPWLAALWRGRGACWSSRIGLKRIDKFQLLTRTCTKLTQGD